MKTGIIVFPGSNCDEDLVGAVTAITGGNVIKLWHKEAHLQDCDVVMLPGGFSFGDYLRSGAIARFSNIMNSVIDHAAKGKPVIGICNGFQILCESGLLPGALLHNTHRKFICKNVFIRPCSHKAIITAGLDHDRGYKIPIAHGEGNFFASEDAFLDMCENDQIIFRYCDENGNHTEESNPNGSLDHVAGICNLQGNVMGMMPHPERAANNTLGNTDGREILEQLYNAVNA